MEKDFLFTASHTLGNMRLVVEGAITLFENETGAYYHKALTEGRTDEAIAFDTLGTALNTLRGRIIDLQAACMEESGGVESFN